MEFLSERSILLHKEYLNSLILKSNIFEKSYRELKNEKNSDVIKSKIKNEEKRKYLTLIMKIKAHRIFFESFSNEYARPKCLKNDYSSAEDFLYKVRCAAEDEDSKFLYVVKNKDKISYLTVRSFTDFLDMERVILAIDLCEHAYFYDYGFDKDSYIRAAVSRLNLGKLEKTFN